MNPEEVTAQVEELVGQFDAESQAENKLNILFQLFALPLLPPLNPNYLRLCDEGLIIATRANIPRERSYILVKKANFLEIGQTLAVKRQKELKLHPGWLNFSLEEERDMYQALTEKIEATGNVIDSLLSEVQIGMRSISDQSALGSLAYELGVFFGNHAINTKLKFLQGYKWAQLRKLLRMEFVFLYDRKKATEVDRIFKLCRKYHKMSASHFELSKEPEKLVRSLLSLAVWEKSFGEFYAAKKTLDKCEKSCAQFGVRDLEQKIALVKHSIRLRDRDAPDYANGEYRK